MDLNKVMIIGRLTRDPESRTTPQGQNVASFGVATNRRWVDKNTGENKDNVEYHNITAWGKLAEIVSQYLVRGKQVYIEGRLQTRDWQAQDGSKKSRTEIVAENLIMLGNKGDTSSSSAPTKAPVTPEEPTVEDIPF